MTFEYDIDKSLEENITELGQKIMTSSFVFINELGSAKKKLSKKEREAQRDSQEEMVRQFKLIKSTFLDLKKMNQIPEKGASSFNEKIVENIKNMTSSLKPIVTRIPEGRKSNG